MTRLGNFLKFLPTSFLFKLTPKTFWVNLENIFLSENCCGQLLEIWATFCSNLWSLTQSYLHTETLKKLHLDNLFTTILKWSCDLPMDNGCKWMQPCSKHERSQGYIDSLTIQNYTQIILSQLSNCSLVLHDIFSLIRAFLCV